MNVNYSVSYTQSATFYDHYVTYFPETFVQAGVAQLGGRLVPRSVFEGNTTALVGTIRSIQDAHPVVNFTYVAMDVSQFGSDEKNAIIPAVSHPGAVTVSDSPSRVFFWEGGVGGCSRVILVHLLRSFLLTAGHEVARRPGYCDSYAD